VEEEAIFVQSYKSRARDLDLEHTLDTRSPGDHRVYISVVAIEPFVS